MARIRQLDTGLWHLLADRMNIGLLVFDEYEQVIFANEKAAEYLDYRPTDLLGLSIEDFCSLIQPDRLDEHYLVRALTGQRLDNEPFRDSYAISTSDRRLKVTPTRVEYNTAPYHILTLEPLDDWRDNLIAEFTTERLHSPLAFASSYCDTLITRLRKDYPRAFALHDLARIVRDSVNESLSMWQMLSRLRQTRPNHRSPQQWEFKPTSLLDACEAALKELQDRGLQGLGHVKCAFPNELPAIRASEAQLHAGLLALFEGISYRAHTHHGEIILSLEDKGSYVKFIIMASPDHVALRGYLFDELPLAITEQLFKKHGGRIWFEGTSRQTICCLSLPAWQESQS